MDNGSGVNGVHITSVYAKYSEIERVDLWDSLANMNSQVQDAWCIGGDFNVILEASEKLGGKLYQAIESLDFANCMVRCGVEDAGYVSSTHTWCNNRRPRKRIWKRFDRVLINDGWLHKFQNIMVRHLSRTGSDHRPLLEWIIHVKGHPMWIMQQKLKNLSKILSVWSKDGDIFKKVEEWEEIVQRLEDIDVMDNTEESTVNLNKGQAEYVSWMAMQEALLKQKAQIRWFEEEDNNTWYFHNVIKDKTREEGFRSIEYKTTMAIGSKIVIRLWDNWTGKGALAKIFTNQSIYSKTKVSEFIQEGSWDMNKLAEFLPDQMVNIIANIHIGKWPKKDMAMWELETEGIYSTKSAQNIIRTHKEEDFTTSQV
ncbi:hypothetical protein MTR67_023833 [Solanum verrucosum]|uniref:Uncharacterized protein n=1 Tax=Solanum verrucosum TaxID=315347 RepID=A0AAF0QWD8_SOLVR|nr:hypothetical protein MTR67_023833 [Solanum verrucosum]